VGTFEIIPGSPAYGEPALSFPRSDRGSNPEGFVVEFTASNGHSWVGYFILGEGWRAPDDTWQQFIVALETGIFTGGAYDWPEP
jgi:hypothetical protein